MSTVNVNPMSLSYILSEPMSLNLNSLLPLSNMPTTNVNPMSLSYILCEPGVALAQPPPAVPGTTFYAVAFHRLELSSPRGSSESLVSLLTDLRLPSPNIFSSGNADFLLREPASKDVVSDEEDAVDDGVDYKDDWESLDSDKENIPPFDPFIPAHNDCRSDRELEGTEYSDCEEVLDSDDESYDSDDEIYAEIFWYLLPANATKGIPFDLVEETVRHLRNDIAALRNLCLTDHSWRSAAVIHLFSRIAVRRESDFAMWNDIVRRTPILGRRAIEHVTYGIQANRSDETSEVSAIFRPFQVQSLHWFTSELPGITTNADVELCFSRFIGFKELRIDSKLDSFSLLSKFIRECGSPHSLTLGDLAVWNTNEPLSTCDISWIKELIIEVNTTFWWLELIVDQNRSTSLIKLALDSHFLPVHSRLVDLSAQTLQHLSLTTYDPDCPPPRSALPALKTLTLGVHGVQANVYLNFVIEFISRLPPTPRLALVTIVGHQYGHTADQVESALAQAQWNEFFTHVLPKTFPSIQHVKFIFDTGEAFPFHDAPEYPQVRGGTERQQMQDTIARCIPCFEEDPTRFTLNVI
ncbi:hypothetical protein C8J56DRAFT_1130946 [Mycena floridula]|nr:hypothetical protein C8J56DRAFT_1130946 [Mycena floridula]